MAGDTQHTLGRDCRQREIPDCGTGEREEKNQAVDTKEKEVAKTKNEVNIIGYTMLTSLI